MRRRKHAGLYGACFVILLLIFALSLPDPLFDSPYSPVLYDREGRLLGALTAQDGQWRFPPSERLNEKFAAALIEAEDRRFRSHPGVDPVAIGRAVMQNLRSRRVVSGASTLTMQTVRLMRAGIWKGRKRGFFEKAMEAFLALRLELGRSKDDILALYTANAPFGANVVGLEAASWRWFGRGAGELSWAEAATLAVLPNAPGLIHPGRNREALKLKRDDLLQRLFDKNLFAEETLRLALAEELPPEPLPLPQLAPHLLTRLVKERGGVAAFRGVKGSPLRSTLDMYIQDRAQAIMNRAAERFAGNGIMNGACVIINTGTGEAAAYVGNVESPVGGDVDIIRARRSSGSLLKPFLYAAMLDSGDILPGSLVSDIPTRVGSYSPENISRSYLGVVPADEALARSLNIPAVRNLRRYGVDRFARLLRALGLTTLFRNGEDYGLPLILGGAEVTLWEITGLYAGLARAAAAKPGEAVFFPPRTDPSSPAAPAASPLSRGAAWLTLEALAFVTRPGEEAHWQEYAGARRIAWKTGTSFGFRDAWAIGTTPEWTAGVWIGNATGEGRAELRSALTAAPVLFELFSALEFSSSFSGAWFPQPAADLKEAEVCGVSGFPPSRDCQTIKTVFLPVAAPPHRPCPYCRLVIDQGVEEKRFVLPPAEEWYYRRWKADYKPLSSERGSDFPMALFNPEEGTGIFVPRELDGSEARVVFSAAHREEDALIHWHLDDEYLGSTSAFHEIEARPVPGSHTLTLVDSKGYTLTRRFRVLGDEAP